jgi:hypothetical protein
MGWTVEPLDAEGFLYLIADGTITTEDVAGQVQEGIALIVSRGLPGAMIDYSKAVLEMPLVDIYKLPDWFEAHALPRETRMAVVLPADPVNMHKYTFFDDVATNRGYLVRLFWESTRARDWLHGGLV